MFWKTQLEIGSVIISDLTSKYEQHGIKLAFGVAVCENLLFDDNVNNICKVSKFMNIHRLEFAKFITKHTKLSPVVGVKLYSKIRDSLKDEAQTLQLGKFISDFDMDIINKDYYHIITII